MTRKPGKEDFEEGKRRIEEIGQRLGSVFGQSSSPGAEPGPGGGFLGGLSNLIEQLGKLAEQAERAGGEVRKGGEFSAGERMKGVYGFTIRSGLGEDKVKVEPFGNLRRERASGRVAMQEVREPIVDLFDESDHLRVVAEVPGALEEDIEVELRDGRLQISAGKGEQRYRKEVPLPENVPCGAPSYSCRNGILEVRLAKLGQKK